MSKVSSTTRDKRSIAADRFAAQQLGQEGDIIDGLVPLGTFNGYLRRIQLIDQTLLPLPPAQKDEKKDQSAPPPSSSEENKEGETQGENQQQDQQPEEEQKENVTTGTLDGLLAWCAEQDGTISVRRADTGGLLTKTAERIQAWGKHFVTCLIQIGAQMWVGYSDGCLRVYDIQTRKMVFEKKRHAGAINAIAHGTYLQNKTYKTQDIIFTASDDFKIMVWTDESEANSSSSASAENSAADNKKASNKKSLAEKETKGIHATGQVLFGHNNSVKCLLVDGDRLYSGSDDGFVRQWTIEEIPQGVTDAPFPLFCSRDGVRHIALYEDYIVTAGAKGGIVARYLDTGEARHTFHISGPTGGGVTALHLAENTGTLLAAGLDGKIDVWDLTTPDFDLLGTVTAHQAQVVSSINPIARSVQTSFILLGEKGNLVQITSESDAGLSEDDAIVTVEEKNTHRAQVFGRIEELRIQLMKNRDTMADKRSQMDRLNFLAAHEKAATAAALTAHSQTLLKRAYMNKCLVWLQRHRNRSKQMIVAEAMMASSDRGLRSLYYSRLAKFSQLSILKKQKQKLSDSIQAQTEKQLQVRYLNQAKEYVRRKAQNSTALQICEAMMNATENGMRAVFFRKWLRFRLRQRELAKRRVVAYSLMKHSEKGNMVLFWNKFAQGVSTVRHIKMKEAAAHAMATTTMRGHRLLIFKRLQQYAKLKKAQRKRELLIGVMARTSDSNLARLYCSKWLSIMRANKDRFSQARLDELKAENEKTLADINNPDIPQEQDLDAMIAQARKDLEEAQNKNKQLNDEVAVLEKEEKKLKKRLAQSVHVDAEKSLVEQMNQTSSLLKPSCLHIQRQLGAAVELYQKVQAGKKTAAAAAEPASPAKSTRAGSTAPSSPAKKSSTTSATTPKKTAGSPTKSTAGSPQAASPAKSEATPAKKEEEPAPHPDSVEGMFHSAVADYRGAIKALCENNSDEKKADDEKKEAEATAEEKKEDTADASPAEGEPAAGEEEKPAEDSAEKPTDAEKKVEEEEDTPAYSFPEGDFWTLNAEETIQKAPLPGISTALSSIRTCLLLWDHLVAKPDVEKKIPNEETFTGKDVNEFIQNASWAMEVMKRDRVIRAETGEEETSTPVDDVPRVGGSGEAKASSSAAGAKSSSSTTAGAKKSGTATSSTATKKSTTTSASSSTGAKKTATTEKKSAPTSSTSKKTSTTSSSSTTAKPGAKKSTTTTAKKTDSSASKKKEEEKKTAAPVTEEKKDESSAADEKKEEETSVAGEEKKDEDQKQEEEAKKE